MAEGYLMKKFIKRKTADFPIFTEVENALNLDNIKISYDDNVISIDGNDIYLRPREMDIFSILHEKKGKTCLAEWIIQRVYNLDEPENSRKAITVHIHSLNKKLESHGYSIVNVWSKGYKLVPLDSKKPRLASQIVEIKGNKKTVKDWCMVYGVSLSSIYNKCNRGARVAECFT